MAQTREEFLSFSHNSPADFSGDCGRGQVVGVGTLHVVIQELELTVVLPFSTCDLWLLLVMLLSHIGVTMSFNGPGLEAAPFIDLYSLERTSSPCHTYQ